MMRVTFDPFYIDDLKDYYRRNECIREQQYLSPQKLLHLAAFCVSTAAENVGVLKESLDNGANREAALEVVRELSALCDNADLIAAQRAPVTIINGCNVQEAQNDPAHSTTDTPPEVRVCYLRLLRGIDSVFYRQVAWLKWVRKHVIVTTIRRCTEE
jgi:hypothetical protein